MNISEIHVDGFGVWHDRSWPGLSPGVNVFCGPNEAGKTTLMSFIRSVLFGFERRNHPRRYEPLDGGNHGGVLDVLYRDNRVRIERKAGRHVRGTVAVYSNDEDPGGEPQLERMLEGTTRTLYHNVFAFGLDELEQFRTLQESEIASHISSAGMGVGAARWSSVWKDLEDRRSGLFLPRGQNSTINRALREMDTVRDELGRVEAEPREYIEAQERRSSLDVEIRELEAQVQDLRRRVAHYEHLARVQPHRKRRGEIEAQIQQMESVAQFPAGGVERLNMLVHRRRELDTELESVGSETRDKRAEWAQLVAGYTPQDLLRHNRLVDDLRTHLPSLEAAEERVVTVGAAREAIQAEYEAALARREAEGPPSAAVTIAFSVVVAMVAGALFLSGNSFAGGGVSVALLLIAGWYTHRVRHAAAIDRNLGEISARLQEGWTNAKRTGIERDRVWGLLRNLTGKDNFSHADLERESEQVRALTATADRIRTLDEDLAREDSQSERLRAQIAEIDRAILELLGEADAPSESEFLRLAEVFGRREKLLEELNRTPSVDVVTADADLAGIVREDPETLGQLRQALDSGIRKLETARIEVGRLEERSDTLSRSEDRSRVRSRQESILARVDDASEKWAVLTLCKTLLDETRRVYETDRQPKVLQHASGFFRQMSDGRWTRIIAPLGSNGLVVESAGGDRVSPENLSRGTAEQLYLAMRLALVREYSNHVEPLPVVFDDIFVNFDPDRTRRAVESVRDLSETHQVLLFTCHPHLVELVEDVVPEPAVHRL